jgi:hypothetical protein
MNVIGKMKIGKVANKTIMIYPESNPIFSNTTNHDHYLTTSSVNNNTFYDLSIIGDVTTQYDLHLLSNIKVNNY